MNCCNDFGQCTNGHGCAARSRTATPREDVEKLLGVWSAELGPAKPAKVGKVGKVGKRTPTFTTNVAPSHWRKTLKALAKWMLIVVVFNMALGFVVGVFA
jgi:hypothetical protein